MTVMFSDCYIFYSSKMECRSQMLNQRKSSKSTLQPKACNHNSKTFILPKIDSKQQTQLHHLLPHKQYIRQQDRRPHTKDFARAPHSNKQNQINQRLTNHNLPEKIVFAETPLQQGNSISCRQKAHNKAEKRRKDKSEIIENKPKASTSFKIRVNKPKNAGCYVNNFVGKGEQHTISPRQRIVSMKNNIQNKIVPTNFKKNKQLISQEFSGRQESSIILEVPHQQFYFPDQSQQLKTLNCYKNNNTKQLKSQDSDEKKQRKADQKNAKIQSIHYEPMESVQGSKNVKISIPNYYISHKHCSKSIQKFPTSQQPLKSEIQNQYQGQTIVHQQPLLTWQQGSKCEISQSKKCILKWMKHVQIGIRKRVNSKIVEEKPPSIQTPKKYKKQKSNEQKSPERVICKKSKKGCLTRKINWEGWKSQRKQGYRQQIEQQKQRAVKVPPVSTGAQVTPIAEQILIPFSIAMRLPQPSIPNNSSKAAKQEDTPQSFASIQLSRIENAQFIKADCTHYLESLQELCSQIPSKAHL